MTFNFSEFLLNTNDEYNGHKKTEVSGISFEDAIQIAKDLEDSTRDKIFVVESYTDGCMTILEKDHWRRGEHHLGHTDRIILNIEKE